MSALWIACVGGYEQGLNPHPPGEASDQNTPRVDDFDVERPQDLLRREHAPRRQAVDEACLDKGLLATSEHQHVTLRAETGVSEQNG